MSVINTQLFLQAEPWGAYLSHPFGCRHPAGLVCSPFPGRCMPLPSFFLILCRAAVVAI